MVAKLFWEKCRSFAIEEINAFYVEAEPDEVDSILLPKMSKQEKIKLDAMKDIYVGKADTDLVKKGKFYFLISQDAQEVKFESANLPSAEFAKGNPSLKKIQFAQIAKVEDIEALKPVFV